jgi:hypothetical protein
MPSTTVGAAPYLLLRGIRTGIMGMATKSRGGFGSELLFKLALDVLNGGLGTSEHPDPRQRRQ